jgi:drug/metabolite transporter (DMT)-like permease
MKPGQQALGITLVLVAAVGFGSGPFFANGAYDAGMTALGILLWRFAFAAATSWVFVLARTSSRAALRALTRPRFLALLFLGFLYVGNSGTYVASLETVPVSLSAVIVYIYPPLVAVLAIRFGRSLAGRRAWVALGIATVGVALAVGATPPDELPPLSGLALVFASPVIYAVWIMCSARLAGERPPDADAPAIPPGDAEAAETGPNEPEAAPAAAVMTTATCLGFAVLVLLTGQSLTPTVVPAAAWPALLGFGVFSGVAVQAFYAGVRRVGSARASLLSTFEPVYTIAVAALLLGEVLTPVQMIGGLMVIGAVILAETAPRRSAEPAAAAGMGAHDPAEGRWPRELHY